MTDLSLEEAMSEPPVKHVFVKRQVAKWKAAVIVIGVLLLIAIGILTKVVKLNTIWASGYQVRGVDVSHYQGEIDWKTLAAQELDFAYIKATEGSSFVDDKFVRNWEEAEETSLLIGAYHFFSFDSAGVTQAEHYIETVGDLSGRLVPVVDVEYYGDKWTNPPVKEDVVRELQNMLDILEEEYGCEPMLYTTYEVYYKYLAEDFEEYPLWIRNVYFSPNVDMRGEWTLWQYSDTEVLAGYQGAEKYIDCNVFAGTREELAQWLVK